MWYWVKMSITAPHTWTANCTTHITHTHTYMYQSVYIPICILGCVCVCDHKSNLNNLKQQIMSILPSRESRTIQNSAPWKVCPTYRPKQLLTQPWVITLMLKYLWYFLLHIYSSQVVKYIELWLIRYNLLSKQNGRWGNFPHTNASCVKMQCPKNAPNHI